MSNQIKKSRNLATTLPVSFIVVVVVCLTLFSAASIYDSFRQYEQDKRQIEQSFLNAQKEIIKREVDRVFDYIQIEQTRFEQGIRQSLHLPADQFQSRVALLVERVGSADIDRVVAELAIASEAVESKTSAPINLLVNAKGQIIGGENRSQMQSLHDAYASLVNDISAMAAQQDGFALYAHNSVVTPTSMTPPALAAIVQPVAATGWYAVTLLDVSSSLATLQQRLLDAIGTIRFGELFDGYLFGMRYDGLYLMHPKKKYIGLDLIDLKDPTGFEINREIVSLCKERGSGFLSYVWDRYSKKVLIQKLSYIRGHQQWQWAIGTGFYLDDLDEAIAAKKTVFTQRFQRQLTTVGSLLLLSVMVMVILARYYARRITREFNLFSRYFSEAARKLRTIDSKALSFREFEDLADNVNYMVDARQKAEAEIVQAKELAEAANKAKSIFLANMSHELRTPLNAVLGFSQLMQGDPEVTKAQSSNLKIINRSGNHLLQLINDVLDMSKIEAGRLQLDPEDFDLGELVRDVTDIIRIQAEEKGLQLILDQTSNFPRFIHGDSAKLRQIFINLLSNSIKFTNTGGTTLRLDAKADGKGGLMLYGEVEDTGSGIKPEDIELIFQPFEQLAESATQKGTGLGLAITRQFVEMMDGEIGAESTPGKGSLFHFKVWVEKAGQEVITKTTAEQRKVIGLEPGQSEFRILIAEDQPENALLLQQILENVGLKVRIAENGQEAVEQFQQWHPQMIWMDRRMPLMGGEEATREIRKLPEGDKVKIVALTASAFHEEKDTIMAAGMDDYIGKPFRPDELFDCMARHLDLRFQYRDIVTTRENNNGVAKVQLNATALTVLSPEFLLELQDAAEGGEEERAHTLINALPHKHSVVGSTMAQMVDEYRFDQLVDLIKAAIEDKDR